MTDKELGPPKWFATLVEKIVEDSIEGAIDFHVMASELGANKYFATIEPTAMIEGTDTVHVHVVPALRLLGPDAKACCDVNNVVLSGTVEGHDVGIQIYYGLSFDGAETAAPLTPDMVN